MKKKLDTKLELTPRHLLVLYPFRARKKNYRIYPILFLDLARIK